MTTAESVAVLYKTYGRNPAALTKALESLVDSLVAAKGVRSAKELATATCRKLHDKPSDRVVCAGCFEAALVKMNGE